ncbi:MAG: hypothetical protein HY701_05630 [Gemmatimonadetes bacterium]|nr:hypothetical protein [Gemmatimonadota bacterium]
MPPPYQADEIASALMDAARRAGLRLERLEVLPDEGQQIWIIRATGPAGEEHCLTFPFASAHGIYTPAEIAAHLTRGTWPFG